MKVMCRSGICNFLPLVLILVIVLSGFTLTIVRQSKFDALQQNYADQLLNVTTKQNLGELIISDLRKVATHFYMILISADHERQLLLLNDVQTTIQEIHTILNVLSEGGSFKQEIPLNSADMDSSVLLKAYTPLKKQQYNLEVLALRPQLVELEKNIQQTIAMTEQRNLLLKSADDEKSLSQAGLQLRNYAKQIHSHLARMTENANLLLFNANKEKVSLNLRLESAKKSNQQDEMIWAFSTILGVFGLIGLIYRQIITAQNHLGSTVQMLQTAEQELKSSHAEVLALNQSLEQQVVARTEALELSERQWSDAFNAVNSPIFIHDQDGRILKANHAYLELADSSLDRAYGQLYWDLFPKLGAPLPGCVSGIAESEKNLCDKAMDVTVGEKIYRSQSFVIQNSQGEYLYSMHLMEDATLERKAQKELLESEKRFREVTNSMNDILILLDKNLNVQLLNDAAIKSYHVDAENFLGKRCHEVFWNCSDKCENCPTLEVLETGRVAKAMRYMDDGTVLDRSIYPVHDNAGNITACAVIASDVTERENYIGKLQRFEQIMSTSTDLIAFFDKNHRFLAANNVYADYFDIAPDEIVGRHAAEIIGQERYNGLLHFQKQVFDEGQTINLTTWADYPVAGRRYVKITLTPYLESNGRVSGFVSRTRDITEKAEQDARLKLSAKVFESTTEGIAITDPAGRILTVNHAFCEITGYAEEEVIGQTPSLLKSGRHDSDFYQQMWQQLSRTGRWRGEVWNRRKTGEIYPELLTISSIKNDDGDVVNFVGVFSDITSLKRAAEKLEHQAHHHPLTGLPNRLLLHARLEHSIQYAKREKIQGAVLFIDLDNFKRINDSLGHNAGDEVLKEVASRLQEHSREVDTVAHIGGDEFVIVMQKIRSIEDVTARAKVILISLQRPFYVDGFELYISASIGIVEFSGVSDDIEALLKNADTAMYKAKEAGKNNYQHYLPEFTENAVEKVLLESHLRRALERNELILHYQPQLSLAEGTIVAVEALVRWDHPEIGLVMPDKFIPLSEESGLIIPIGEWVLRTACRQLMAWRAQGFGLARIAVNLSGKQIQLQKLPQVIQDILDETGCPAEALELEITESFMMQHPEQSITVLRKIRDLGVELSIDDFGTGHSSLNYLRRLPINRLKIDRSFVWDIHENPEGEAIVKAIIAMGHSLDLAITAEGIETEEQRLFLDKEGCDDGQGFLFSKALPAEQIEAVLHEKTADLVAESI
ncbi:MAG: EAL domain-containing protein [Desulfuromonadales bacterium]|nr:EAL domain-containing protein [Desulfuromonadales bacterium]